ncbi:MAG: hypothetical protein V3R84_07205 [Acidimicrobiia bacterium]
MTLPPGQRPFVNDPITTSELPPTPQRSYRIPAHAWVDAPDELLGLGTDLGESFEYKRRIGRFLLWRTGPPVGEARYLAIADDLSASFRFDLHGRAGTGLGADGIVHARFRSSKESLRD